MTISQQIHLASRPSGIPNRNNFKAVEVELAALKQGEILVQNTWMSVDPYMRGRMVDRDSYIPPFQLNHVLDGGAVGEVIESKNEQFPVGAKVSHLSGWRSHFISTGEDLTLLPATGLPEQSFLGVMGMPGLTAWVGLFKIAKLKPSDTVFISAASGAVGSIVCQIAKLTGCKVIASVGSDEKAELVKAYGVDAVINYKKTNNLTQALQEAAPQGIDVYFENVGGEHLEAALNVMNEFGRIAACGMIAGYNDATPQAGPANLFLIIVKKLSIQGFIVMDHFDQYAEFAAQMGQWLTEGKIKSQETVYHGLEQAADAFIGLFEGKNKGKMLVKL